MKLIVVLTLVALACADQKAELKCLVCKAIMQELEHDIGKVDPNKKVDVGTFRLDSDGNQKQTSVPFARSEMHLMDLLETVCQNFQDYAQAKYKSNGKLTLLRLIGHDGKMNEEMSAVDMIPDLDTNNNLQFYCESIIEEHEEAIVKALSWKQDDPALLLCTKGAGLCNDDSADNDDYNFEDHEEL